MDEGPRCPPKPVHLVGFLRGQDLRVQRERRRAGQLTLLLVLPGLQGVLKGLGCRSQRYTLSCEHTSNHKHRWDTSGITG